MVNSMKKKILLIIIAVLLIVITSGVGIAIANWQITHKTESTMTKTRYKVTLVAEGQSDIVYDNLEENSYVYLPYVSHDTKYFTGWKLGETTLSGANGELAFEVQVSTLKGATSNTEFILNASFENVPDNHVLFKVSYSGSVIKQVLVSKTETKFYAFNINVPEKQSNAFLSYFTISESLKHYSYFGDEITSTRLNLNDYFLLADLSNQQIINLTAVYE